MKIDAAIYSYIRRCHFGLLEFHFASANKESERKMQSEIHDDASNANTRA